MRAFHLIMTVVWVIMVPVSLVTGWVESLVFISACSIYANAASHFSAFEGAAAKKEAES
jgi:hypothetical protein